MIIFLLYWTYDMINRIHEKALRRVYDDYTSNFYELMVRIVYDDYNSTFNELMVR